MDDIMNKLQNMLNDEESMKQIKELADMLSGEIEKSPDTPSENSPHLNDTTEVNNSSQDTPDISKILQNLSNFMGNQSNDPQSSQNNMPDIDIGKIMQLRGIVQSAVKPDNNINLLMALRPMLKKESQLKIDRLIKIFRLFALYPALKNSGLLGGDILGLF